MQKCVFAQQNISFNIKLNIYELEKWFYSGICSWVQRVHKLHKD